MSVNFEKIKEALSSLGLVIQDILPVRSTQPSNGNKNYFSGVPLPVPPTDNSNKEIIGKLIFSAIGMGVSCLFTWGLIKVLANALDPTKKEKSESRDRALTLLKNIGIENNVKLSEYELCIASDLVDPLTMHISWKDIGGLDPVIQDIQESVILPFQKGKLFEDSLLSQPPKGVLMYGPPGCGKTLIAKATAKAAGARFINLQVSSLVDKWYGESQKRAQAVFSLAVKLQPVIIFIDEIDSFLRSRMSSDHEATAMIKTQFMSFWDGLMTDHKCRVMIMGATNRPNDVDAAILRRMPSKFYIGPPNSKHRKQILEVILRGEPVAGNLDKDYISESTEGFSGSDLKELCRNAALYRVRDYLNEEKDNGRSVHQAEDKMPVSEDAIALRAITTDDFTKALQKMRSSGSSNLPSMHHIEVE